MKKVTVADLGYKFQSYWYSIALNLKVIKENNVGINGLFCFFMIIHRCHACSKAFSQAANLTAHARTHSGEKPFRCPVCDRRFSQSSSVTTHMRTHSGERPYR